MLNPESVDKLLTKVNKPAGARCCVEILFTDDKGDECLRIQLEISDARRLARMILKETAWKKAGE